MPRPRLSGRPPPPARASPRDAPIRSQPTFRAAVANAADHHAPLDGAPRRSTPPVDHSRAEKPARAAERPPALALTQAAAPTSCPNAPSTTGACNGHTALHSLRRTSPHTRIDFDAHQLADATSTPNRPHAAELSVARHLGHRYSGAAGHTQSHGPSSPPRTEGLGVIVQLRRNDRRRGGWRHGAGHLSGPWRVKRRNAEQPAGAPCAWIWAP